MQENSYDFQVKLRYQLYNSIFLTLDFATIKRTGIELPVFREYIARGLKEGKSPMEIIERFFEDHKEYDTQELRHSLLFRFIQYVERQIVLIDALEEASYEMLNDLNGEGSLSHFMQRVSTDGKTDALRAVLQDFRVKIVLTAHPTQFYPGYVLGIITDLSRAFAASDLHSTRDLLEQLGQTPFYKKEKPSPYDEAISLGWYLENVFYHAIPKVVMKAMGDDHWLEDGNYRLLEVGFWPGGDRDGNPFVTTDITWQVALRLQFILYKAYFNDVRNLKRKLTFRDVIPVMEAMEEKLRYAIFEKDKDHTFDLEAFQHQLLEVHRLLEEHHQGYHAEDVRSLIIKTKLFCRHFASLDIRQDSRVVHRAFVHLFGEQAEGVTAPDDYFKLKGPTAIPDHEEHIVADTLAVFRTIDKIQRACGELACHRFIISNCRNETSVLEIYAMANACGMPDPMKLDIVPLFETIEDLQHAPEAMKELFENKTYRKHVTRRGGRQYIMLGFSDGTKDGGYFSANWSIHRAKEEMTTVARASGVEVVFFDGRGGPPARGGGNVRKYYAAQGSRVEDKEIQLTIQGQTISSRFGSVNVAAHFLENLLTAGLENRLYGGGRGQKEAEAALMQEIAEISLKAYTKLKERPDFMAYLEHRSPLKFFGKTNIGSRPSKRGKSSKLTLDDLRAIPFVASWSALKQNVPGYFGLGIALEQIAGSGRMEELEALFRNNPYFASLVNNSMQSLSKTRMELTRFTEHDPEYAGIWTAINEENERSRAMISKLLGTSGWEETLSSMSSIELREDIVLPLLIIQQYALMRLEQDTTSSDVYEHLVIRSLYGVINAARNSA